jgi:hypothetical protein
MRRIGTLKSLPWWVPNRFSIATTPSLQDGIAKELNDAELLAHGQHREPRAIEFDDLPKLAYLQAVRLLSAFEERDRCSIRNTEGMRGTSALVLYKQGLQYQLCTLGFAFGSDPAKASHAPAMTSVDKMMI